jgi:nucleoside-diphosphate-sugar epimerase
VDDVAEAVRALILDWHGDGHEVFNVGRAGLVPTEGLARYLCRALVRPESLIALLDRGPLVNGVKNGSFAKAEACFGFRTRVDLEEGIARTIAWHEATIP